MLKYPEEEQRRDATEIGGKTTGANCSVLQGIAFPRMAN